MVERRRRKSRTRQGIAHTSLDLGRDRRRDATPPPDSVGAYSFPLTPTLLAPFSVSRGDSWRNWNSRPLLPALDAANNDAPDSAHIKGGDKQSGEVSAVNVDEEELVHRWDDEIPGKGRLA